MLTRVSSEIASSSKAVVVTAAASFRGHENVDVLLIQEKGGAIHSFLEDFITQRQTHYYANVVIQNSLESSSTNI